MAAGRAGPTDRRGCGGSRTAFTALVGLWVAGFEAVETQAQVKSWVRRNVKSVHDTAVHQVICLSPPE